MDGVGRLGESSFCFLILITISKVFYSSHIRRVMAISFLWKDPFGDERIIVFLGNFIVQTAMLIFLTNLLIQSIFIEIMIYLIFSSVK